MRYECDGCGARVAGTIAGKCSRCLDEDRAVKALVDATECMRKMVEERRDRDRIRRAAYMSGVETSA